MGKNYIEFTAFGVYCGEFINYLMNSGYRVSEVSSANDIFTVRTSIQSYPKIAKKAREYRVKTRVVKRGGIYFTLRRYRKRIGVPLGILAFLAIVVLMSNFVWSIKITGNENIGSYRILEQLDKSGIRPGVNIRSVNANKAELELRLAVSELMWISIERSGSRIYVKISETDDFSEPVKEGTPPIPLQTPCNVISDRTGQLVRAEVYQGKLLYEVSSGINAGDVVVSGAVENGTGGYSLVHADAKLILETAESVNFYQTYTNLRRTKNGRSVNRRSAVFLGKRFGKDLKIDKNADHVDYSETITAPKIFGFPLPLRILAQSYVFYDRVEVTDSSAEAKENLDKQIELYESNFMKDTEIIDKQPEYFPDDNGIGCTVKYLFRADAARQIVIDN
jgi:similar to stage IV sporulation protein